MRRGQRLKPVRERATDAKKEIRYKADYQQDWEKLIAPERDYLLQKINFLSILGDAPKDFITDCEYREGHRNRRQRRESYIAKVGSKFYPNESIVEHLITRIGQTFGLKIADSKLRMVDRQVRFMSKYFLNRHSEQLTHGAEIFEFCIGKESYAELAEKREENKFFTFQMVCESVKTVFPEAGEGIMRGFVEMLTFDALIGHNDRHPYNWAVIVPLRKNRSPRFSPVYDTARALFWNKQERHLRQMLTDKRQFENYINSCEPPIRWDGELEADYFRLIGLIWRDYPQYRRCIEKFMLELPLNMAQEIVDKEFSILMSMVRRELIKRCLMHRYQRLCAVLAEFRAKEEEQYAN